mgnify:FL=1
MITLTLVRHGETDWNFARRIQGSTDIPLNETGRAQAREAAETLRPAVLGASESPFLVASDLSRATETAQIIARELGLAAPRLFPELRERAYGEAEGILVDDFYARFGEGGQDTVPGAETNAELQTRAVLAIARVTAAAGDDADATNRHIIAVSHGGFIREVISHATQGERPLPGERLGNASAHTFRLSDDEIHLVEYVAHQN